MRKEPAYVYYCEECGKQFSDEYECKVHEQDCKRRAERRKERIKNCRYCGGNGYITEPYQEGYDVQTEHGDYRHFTRLRYKEIKCPRCNY